MSARRHGNALAKCSSRVEIHAETRAAQRERAGDKARAVERPVGGNPFRPAAVGLIGVPGHHQPIRGNQREVEALAAGGGVCMPAKCL